MNFYPEQLEQLAKICRALNSVDSQASARVVLGQRLPVVDPDDDRETPIGHLIDEIGGAWSFKPAEDGVGA